MDHATCSGFECAVCAIRCPHCRGRLIRTPAGVLTCTAGCVIHVWDLWPGALAEIRAMFAGRRRENLSRLRQRKRWLSDRETTEAWNADRHVPMTYETADGS
jgi:hypothetical protein